MHGTFLNNVRLSESKMASQPFLITHLDEIRIGSTVLQAHFCESCEICDKIIDEISVEPTAEIKKIKADRGKDVVASGENYIGWKDDYERKKSMTIPVLRPPQLSFDMFQIDEKQFLPTVKRIVPANVLQTDLNTIKRIIPTNIFQTDSNPPTVKLHSKPHIQFTKPTNLNPPSSSLPSSSRHHNHKYKPYKPINPTTRSSLTVKISSGKGNELLKKMGWKEGSGLGANCSGIVEPIDLVKPRGKSGIGYSRKKM
jgi:hypothetical protein